MRPRVYVAGPYSANNVMSVLANMRNGICHSVDILISGMAPFCPWLDYQFSLESEIVCLKDYYDYSMAWLDVSDVIYVIPGWETSKGTRAEMRRARILGIPIVYAPDIHFLEQYFQKNWLIRAARAVHKPFRRFVGHIYLKLYKEDK